MAYGPDRRSSHELEPFLHLSTYLSDIEEKQPTETSTPTTRRLSSRWPALRRPGILGAISPQLALLALVIIASLFGMACYSAIQPRSLVGIANLAINSSEHAHNDNDRTATEKWSKPTEFKIIGLLFFGRPATVEILDCYLQQNLVSNGGFLDELHFVVNTAKKQDLEYLDKLVGQVEGYKKIVIEKLGYQSIWEHTVERNNMYIKIDDDLVG